MLKFDLYFKKRKKKGELIQSADMHVYNASSEKQAQCSLTQALIPSNTPEKQ